jgi:hypothetical protein
MVVMFDVTNPVERAHTMAKSGGKTTGAKKRPRSAEQRNIPKAILHSLTDTTSQERSHRLERFAVA